MTFQTRSQSDMGLAAQRVAFVESKNWKDDYGRLCHTFPVMVLTCGLCQAVAFSAAKSVGAETGNAQRRLAHARILEDFEAITGCAPDHLPQVPAQEYILHTRRILAAWIYYKRFAVSILNVNEGDGSE